MHTMSNHMKAVPFNGIRIVHETSKDYDRVQFAMQMQLGSENLMDAVKRASTVPDEATYNREIDARYAGPSGFMRLTSLDHGKWIGRFGIKRRSVRWIFGNPAVALTMLRHDISAGLFVPIELLITESEDGRGTIVTYIQPSSLIAISPDAHALREAAERLDAKAATLVQELLSD
jgi:uncharacterized protein (DUF302 family)